VEIIIAPQNEEEVLSCVQESATVEEIRDGIVSKAQCCVDHLCGCK